MDIKENNNKESEKSNNILESNFNEEDYINENNNQVRYTELNENFDDNPLGFSEYKDSRISFTSLGSLVSSFKNRAPV